MRPATAIMYFAMDVDERKLKGQYDVVDVLLANRANSVVKGIGKTGWESPHERQKSVI